MNFFNAIGFTDIERIHSAMLGWILSDNCDVFDIKERSFLLTNFFGCSDLLFQSIESRAEKNSIDILFVTTSIDGNKEYWVVENKFKSVEHHSLYNGKKIWQTEKYKAVMEDKYPNQTIHYAYLTLQKEAAKEPDWYNITYCQVVEIIEKLLLENGKSTFHAAIINEYVSSIKTVLNALDDYMNKPIENDFIRNNRLATTFQRYYLRSIVECMKCSKTMSYHIHEYNGTACVDFTDNTKYKDCEIGIQIQNGSLKLFFGNKEEEKKIFLSKWEQRFNEAQNKHWIFGKLRLNKPQTQASISLSLKPDKNWKTNPKEEVARIWDETITELFKVRDFILKISNK